MWAGRLEGWGKARSVVVVVVMVGVRMGTGASGPASDPIHIILPQVNPLKISGSPSQFGVSGVPPLLDHVAHELHDYESDDPPLLGQAVYDVCNESSYGPPLLDHAVYEVCDDS